MVNKYLAWKHKREIVITNPSSTAGFQGNFVLNYLPGMRYDFRDIRFTDKYGNPLKYALESIVNFTSCRVWISLPANDSYIYLYYGNGAVASESSPSTVFNFWDDFSGSSINTTVWTVSGSGGTVSGSILTMQNSSQSAYIESKSTFAPNSLVEIKQSHYAGQRGPFGFRNNSTQKTAAWQGAAGSLNTDHRFAHNGSTGNWDNDGVNRSGAYHIYGVAHIAAGPKYYVDYTYRGEITTYIPGSVNLPVHAYCYSGEGYVKIDWVRVRKYAATEPTLTLGKKYTQKDNGFLQKHDYFYDSVSVQISSTESIKDIFSDSVTVNVETGFFAGQPRVFTDLKVISVSIEEELISRNELRDYSLISCDITKAATDAYMQLSAEFADTKVQEEGATVKYYARDSSRNSHLLFWGKNIANSPSIASFYKTLHMQAADATRNLSVQPIPWNWQVISLAGEYSTWPLWIAALLDYDKTGVAVDNIIDNDTPDYQFVFDPKTTRWEAIKKICDYCNLIINVKLIEIQVPNLEDPEIMDTIVCPGFSAVSAADIDQPYGGFDLPAPLIFDNPEDYTIIDQPTIQGAQDEKYNTVMVYGTITSTGETVVSCACTPRVYMGQEKARVYPIQDNTIEEKGSTAGIESVKWLLYFSSLRATVSMKFLQRFDFALYQRVKFTGLFPPELRALTSSDQLPYVAVWDPRDEINSKHTIDVSGVPAPTWLRVSELKYHSAENEETVELKLITDYIYSSIDPPVPAPYNQYISPGYFKPVSDDAASTTQSIVENTVEKQLTPEICTVLSIDEENQTRLVQTQSGKLVTTKYG